MNIRSIWWTITHASALLCYPEVILTEQEEHIVPKPATETAKKKRIPGKTPEKQKLKAPD